MKKLKKSLFEFPAGLLRKRWRQSRQTERKQDVSKSQVDTAALQ